MGKEEAGELWAELAVCVCVCVCIHVYTCMYSTVQRQGIMYMYLHLTAYMYILYYTCTMYAYGIQHTSDIIMTSFSNLQGGRRDHEGLRGRYVVSGHDGGLTTITIHLVGVLM